MKVFYEKALVEFQKLALFKKSYFSAFAPAFASGRQLLPQANVYFWQLRLLQSSFFISFLSHLLYFYFRRTYFSYCQNAVCFRSDYWHNLIFVTESRLIKTDNCSQTGWPLRFWEFQRTSAVCPGLVSGCPVHPLKQRILFSVPRIFTTKQKSISCFVFLYIRVCASWPLKRYVDAEEWKLDFPQNLVPDEEAWWRHWNGDFFVHSIAGAFKPFLPVM